MNDSLRRPKPKLDLERLSDQDLEKLVSVRSDRLVEAESDYWLASCEAMVRELKAAWPLARYLSLGVDANEYGEFWSLEAVYDETGGVLSSFEIDPENFSAFEESFVNEYRHIYTREFGIDDSHYFDLQARRSLTEGEYNMNVTGRLV